MLTTYDITINALFSIYMLRLQLNIMKTEITNHCEPIFTRSMLGVLKKVKTDIHT